MNQNIKARVYQRGTKDQAKFMARISGMNEEQEKLFLLLHDGKDDDFIRDVLGLSKKSFDRVEDAVRVKLLLAVFDCINYTMEHR